MVFMYLFCGSSAWAGEVILVNGDRLSGTVDAIVGGKLQLRSPLLGQVEIDMIHVDSISSDEIVTVVLSDGRTVARRLRGIESRRVQLQDDQGRIEQAVELDQIEAVNPPPKEEPKWTGSITGGLTSIHGNTYLTTSFELRARLTEKMFTNFRTIFDYDATPAPGKSSTDIKHILGVGWDF